ncbi:MAG TPA: PhaM family polyhydroxyalkanoate granule multifunctional regulatory protein [Casimicrobiaceae bacterium]|nr:PhaM family polyhydroxyalkanoate granule multifunctional regulatory protein [Casimicrobiaceae bacterium]
MADDRGSSSTPPAFPFSPQDAMAFMQKMWNPLGVPIPGFGLPGTAPGAPEAQALPFPNPATLFAALDPNEIERKIIELRIVENWLSMNLNMIQMSIKTLELQKASLEALAAAQQSMNPQAAAPRGAGKSSR